MNKHCWHAISLVELLVVVLFFAMLLAILAAVIVPKIGGGPGIEYYKAKDIVSDFQSIPTDNVRLNKLIHMPEVQGFHFYRLALKEGVLSPETRDKLVSTDSATDVMSETNFFGGYKTDLLPENCSYTAPKSTDVASMLGSFYTGKRRKVFFCFNSRNWHSASAGVMLFMTDGSVAESFDYDLYTLICSPKKNGMTAAMARSLVRSHLLI